MSLEKGSRMTLHAEFTQAFVKAIEISGEGKFKQTSMFLKGRCKEDSTMLAEAA